MNTVHDRIARPGAAVILTIVIILAALGLASLLVWQNYRAALTVGEARAQSAADIVAAHMEWMIEASDQALRRIDTAIGDRPIGSSETAVDNISDAVGDLPSGFQYSVYDEKGSLKLSSVHQAVGLTVADRDYFKEVKAGQEVLITPRLIERLTGEAVFIMARRITRHGQFHGMATIAIPSKKIDEFWASVGLGPLSTVAVVRLDGWVVARHPDLDRPLNISSSRLFTLLPGAKQGTYYNRLSAADGLTRIVGYRQIGHWPLIAASGIEFNEALQVFWRTLELQLAFGLPLLILLVGFAIWISWLLHAYAARNIELEQAIERNHFLLREIHHRVKNNLQAVSSLIRLQPLPEAVRSDMARRVAAMVAVHEHIYQSDQFDRVELSSYVERLVSEIAKTYHQDVDIRMQLSPVTVDLDIVLPLGLIINEVVSNAFKYAFSGDGKGRLLVEMSDDGGGQATLRIIDNGPGMAGDAKKGMGSRLITGFVSQVGGHHRFENADGTAFVLVFPVRLAEDRNGSSTRNAA